jgi:nucleoside-diphosphate-sugar epimerase
MSSASGLKPVIDEEHPPLPEFGYALSKLLAEEMARHSRWNGVPVYPEVDLRGGVAELGTLLSIEKARRVLGYEPAFSWRDAIGDRT